MIELLKNPSLAIKNGKKKKDIGQTIKILFVEWILVAIGIFLIPAQLGGLAIFGGAAVAFGFFIIGVLATLFFGYLTYIVMSILTGRGSYYEGLTSLTYGLVAFSVGFLISAILSLIPIIGGAIGFIVISITMMMTIATFYRAVKEFFKTDLITAWIGIGILVLGVMLAFYFAAMFTLVGSLPFLQQLSNMGAMSSFPAV